MNRKKQQKTREEHIEEVLAELEKDLSNFQFTIQEKDKVLQEYVKLLRIIKIKYQKLFNENEILKEKLEETETENQNKTEIKKQ